MNHYLIGIIHKSAMKLPYDWGNYHPFTSYFSVGTRRYDTYDYQFSWDEYDEYL